MSSFVGRETELKDALQRLERTRLLTVVGPGGAGKRGGHAAAVRAIATFEGASDESGITLGPNERAIKEEALAHLQSEMPAAEFEAVWAEGYRTQPEAAFDQLIALLEER